MHWGTIFQPTIDKEGAWRFLSGQNPGSFVVRNGTQGLALTSMKAGAQSAAEMHHLTIVETQQGAYIKFSELIGRDVQTLVGVILTNPDRAAATGIPHSLLIPQANQRPPLRPPAGGGGGGAQVGYDEAAGDDGEYGALDDGNPDDTYEEFDDEADRANGGRRAVQPVVPVEEDDYGAIDNGPTPGDDEDEYGEINDHEPPLPQGNAHEAYDDAEESDGDYGPSVAPGRPPPIGRRAVPPPADEEDPYDEEDYGPTDTGPPPRPPPMAPGGGGEEEDYGPMNDEGGPPPRPPPMRGGGGGGGGYQEDYDDYDDAEGNAPPMPPRPPKN